MRSLLARLAVLGAFAVTMSACSNGNGSALPYAGPPNNSGGVPGTIQSGANGQDLLRFVQGSPDYGPVDVCVDNLPFAVTAPSVAYGKASALFSVAGGIPHVVAVYPSLGGSAAGNECATAPGPYLGVSPIKYTTISPGNNVRQTIVLGGTAAGGTLGLYLYGEPAFLIAPAGAEAISHNAAPTFSTGKPGVGFGIIPSAGGTPTALAGANNVAKPTVSTSTASTSNTAVVSGLNAVPLSFYDGIGVPTGNPVPITTIPAPNATAGQPYVVELYGIDAPAGGLGLVAVMEQTLGYGF